MYLFFLGVVPLPVTPGALTIKTPSLNQTVNLVNEGEINIPKKAGLREISFDFLLPQVRNYPFANYPLPLNFTASIIIPLLNYWKNTMLPFRFIVVRTTPKYIPLYFTYIKCVIEDFEYNEDAEEHGMDVMCSITLKEYVDYGTKIVERKKDENGNDVLVVKQSRPSDKTIPSTVTTTEGDTLPNIAKKATGHFDTWQELGEANGFAIGEDGLFPEIDLPGMSTSGDMFSGTVSQGSSLPTTVGSLTDVLPAGTPLKVPGLDRELLPMSGKLIPSTGGLSLPSITPSTDMFGTGSKLPTTVAPL